MNLSGLTALNDGEEYLSPVGIIRKCTMPDGTIAASIEDDIIGSCTITISPSGCVDIKGSPYMIEFLRLLYKTK